MSWYEASSNGPTGSPEKRPAAYCPAFPVWGSAPKPYVATTHGMLTQAIVVEELLGPFVLKDVYLDDNLTESEILVKIVASGICGSDWSYISGTIPTTFPGIFGHEGAGIVEKTGSGVTDVVPGDKVILSFSHCKSCKQCRFGRPNICDKYNELNLSGLRRKGGTAFTDTDGTVIGGSFVGQSSFARHTIVDESAVTKVAADSNLELLASVGCGQITGGGAVLNVLKPETSSSICVFGVGAVGVAAIMGAAMSPVSQIIAVDLEPTRLKLALELGATHVINARETADVVGELKRLTGGHGVDYAVDCSGNKFALQQALESLARGGTLGSVGIPPTSFKLDITVWEHIMSGRTYKGCVMGGCVPQEFIKNIVNWQAQKKWPLEKFSTVFKFSEITAAFAAMKDGSVCKPILVWD